MGITVLIPFLWGLLYEVLSYICISYKLILVGIYTYRFSEHTFTNYLSYNYCLVKNQLGILFFGMLF